MKESGVHATHSPGSGHARPLHGLLVLGLLYTLYFAREFLLPIVLAIILSFLLKPVVRWLRQVGIPEGLGALLVLVTLVGSLGTAAVLLTEPITGWIAQAPEVLEKVEQKARDLLQPGTKFDEAAKHVDQIANLAKGEAEPIPEVELKRPNAKAVFIAYGKEILFMAGSVIVLVYFVLARGGFFGQRLFLLVPGINRQQDAKKVALEIEEKISTYLFTITMINAAFGVAIGLSFAILGMPNPVLWGVLAAFLNFIPYLGAMIGISLAAVISFYQFESVGYALIAPGIYLGVNFIENILTPVIQQKRMDLNPLAIFIFLIFWFWLWGIPGLFLAVPLLITLKIFCDHVPKMSNIAEFLCAATPKDAASQNYPGVKAP